MNPIEETKSWIKRFILALNICPFAAPSFRGDKIHYHISKASSPEQQLAEFYDVMEYVMSQTPKDLSNAFIIYPEHYQEFDAFLDFFYFVETFLTEMKLERTFQLVSFHPNYQFDGYTLEDAANQRNQSPYPMIHLLRVEEVTEASQNIDAAEITQRNIDLLRKQ